ncbi:MAG: ATP-binding cassette domain-containing protein [Nitratireductor sp.]|nr:ATP-binding cassette domain-containing protein [Nitratireductor sp.]
MRDGETKAEAGRGHLKLVGAGLPGHHALSCRNLTYRAGGRPLIDGISLDLVRGGITAVIGYNGAGKSLLLRLLHGLIRPSSGEILWHGEALSPAHRKLQAMVFQKPVLLRRNALDNVVFALASHGIHDRERAEDALFRVGLADAAGRAARLLSGGEQQRLMLAMALARAPQLLFLDEATASLDPASIQAIEEIVLDAVAAGTKVVMVTHDLGQAKRLAGEVVFIDRGRKAEAAPTDSFFNNPRSAVAQAYLEGRLPHQFQIHRSQA